MSARTKIAVVDASPLKPERSYRDFDDFMAAIDKINDYQTTLSEVADKLDEALKDANERPTDKQINVLTWAVVSAQGACSPRSRPDNLPAVCEKMRADAAFYGERDALWDNTDKWIIARKVVAEGVGLLVGSFPNAGPHAPEVYTAMIIEEIIAAKPNPLVFEAACREVRRTMKFPPSIAEFLAVMEKVSTSLADKWDMLDGRIEDYIEGRRAAIAKTVAKAQARLAEVAKVKEANHV